MKKRITLPSDFRKLLEQGNIDGLKAIFEKCDINAKDGTYGSNAFELTPLPREFAVWLKEQGADINKKDYYGTPPIFNHASSYNGDVRLLIELGADLSLLGRDNETALHQAARYCRLEAAKILIEHGANVNAQSKNELMDTMYTPLEVVLIENRRAADSILELCSLFLANGTKITDKMKEAVLEIGKNFEFRKNAYTDNNERDLQSNAMKKLYEMFDVLAVKQIEIHDGISPIVITETNFVEQYNKLWEYLVPSNSYAKTGQGEVLRIVGKVAREIMDNGGINWDKEYKKMLDIFPKYFKLGNSLPKEDMKNIDKIIKIIYKGHGDDEPERLSEYAVKWILLNQNVIEIITPTYKR